MSETEIAGALEDTFWVILKLGGPIMVIALVVGLAVSLLQAITQINEASLAFVPKLLVLLASLALFGPFMVSTLDDYTHALMAQMITVGGR